MRNVPILLLKVQILCWEGLVDAGGSFRESSHFWFGKSSQNH